MFGIKDARSAPNPAITQSGQSMMDGGYTSAPERGARRRKLAGYLKAANELRQSYQQSYGLGGQRDGTIDDDGNHVPGSFPDATASRSGDEEMLLFPSYAVRHSIRKGQRRDIPGATQDIRSNKGTGDAEYWQRQWEKYEDQNAVVDVDVRGWVYAPHRGQMTRKNRLLVGIARQLSGIPAPSSSRASSPSSPHHARVEARRARQEEEMVEQEAESITRKGQGEADIAWRGGYSEAPGRDEDDISESSKSNSPDHSRPASPEKRNARTGEIARPISNGSLRGDQYDPGTKAFSKKTSWSHPSEMTPAELNAANAHMMVRLKPFLSNPLTNTTLTVFFYNDSNSRSRTIATNEAGHFSLRAALDFVPTNVRVLASDKLSATEEVHISEPSGISMISDIDDTIKHSGIGNGAREIFRNAFIRDLGDLTIDGVKEWYTTLANLGVKFHYVSNSPWQLYPVLVSYFAQAGLPKGSFHLKQYTGMLQGIFEPVAERKKGTLERILSDFPERRFILAGDSGEADLELYTDIVLANPGRILGVFIRDVTTSKPPAFFDSSMRSMRSTASQSPPMQGRSNNDSGIPPKKQVDEKPPALPPRQASHTASAHSPETSGPTMGILIDFDEEPTPEIHHSATDPTVSEAERKLSTTSIKSLPPSRPSKPKALRSTSGTEQQPSSSPPSRKPAPPPPNPKPRQYSTSQENPTQPTDPSPLSQTQNVSPPGSRSSSLDRQSYTSAVRTRVASAYNALPSLYSTSPYAQQQQQPPPPTSSSDPQSTPRPPPPPVPPRRNYTSYPAAAAHYATNRLSGGWSGYSDGGGGGGSADDANGEQVLSKKEELWLKRWARAKEIFDEKGVVLRAWRVGEDVADEAVRLVEGVGREGRGKEKGR